jgi:predicted enzyme related to lactoylglutathione lyase
MTGLRETARTSEVTAIHTTSLVSALHIYAKMIRLRDDNEPAKPAVIACKSDQLELTDGRVCDMEPAASSGIDVCVRFVTPSIRHTFTTLQRAGAHVIEGVTKLEDGRSAFRLADARGNVIEIVGKP